MRRLATTARAVAIVGLCRMGLIWRVGLLMPRGRVVVGMRGEWRVEGRVDDVERVSVAGWNVGWAVFVT